jgi:D-glucosaminate-6-phosphate ammonia-lyase
MSVTWDPAQLGITGPQVSNLLYEGNPRIDNGGGGRGGAGGSITFVAHMMMPGEEKIVAERVFDILSKPPKLYTPKEPAAAASSVNGRWDVHVEYLRGVAEHSVALEQQGNRLVGTHYGELLSGDLQGSLEGSQISMRSSHRYEGTGIGYSFTGTVSGDTMQGVLSVGEYGEAKWTARKHQYGQQRRPDGAA